MHIRYGEAIGESLEDLAQHERRLRGHKAATRVRLLILLKSGQAWHLGEAAPLVGYSLAQVTRWWARYRRAGLAALEQDYIPTGLPTRLTPEARAALHAAMERGTIATLDQARQYLRDHWGIVYHSLNGIWWQFRQERTRKKTGRTRHVRSSAAKQEAFKKTSPASEA